MEDKPKVKSKKKIIILIVSLLVLVLIGFYFLIYRPMMEYVDTHTWATIQFIKEPLKDFRVGDESKEFLKGDTYQLNYTTITIKDITHEGRVTMEFEPAVTVCATGELIEEIAIDKEDICFIISECSDGETTMWMLRVISNRYR